MTLALLFFCVSGTLAVLGYAAIVDMWGGW